MRVTHSMLTSTSTGYLMRDLEQLLRLQEKIATGRNYTRPSDNPVATAQIVHFNAKAAETEQYRRTVDSGISWNEMTSSVLTQVEDLLGEILDVSDRASHGAATSAERLQAAEAVDSLLEEMIMAANRRFRGKYLFGGAETLTVPFTAQYDASGESLTGVAQNPAGIDTQWSYLVSEVDTVLINTPGSEVFQLSGAGASNDVFQIVVDLRQALREQDFTAIEAGEGAVRDAILRIAAVNSSVGNRINHLESIGEDLDATLVDYTAQRSKLADADIAEAIIEFNVADSIYQTALASTARILQLSLVDFI
jgi:flagellar hook-associated protein 3 FlgL